MIGRGEAISHTANAIGYAEQKLDAKEIDRGLVCGETKEEIFKEFQMFQEQNTRCEKNTFSFVVSPAEADGKNLTDQDFRGITRDFLEKMELQDRQYVAYKHIDNGNPHLHIYVNRIDLEGKAAPDTYISNKASRTADEIAQERQLIQARQVQIQNQLRLEKKYSKVYEAHKSVLKAKPKDLGEYTSMMKKHGYEPKIKYSKLGKPVGMQFKVGGELVKGSAINKLMSAGNVHKAVIDISKTIVRNIGKGLSYGI
jgi:hypothetical protein